MADKTLSDAMNTSRFRIVDSHCHLGVYNKFDLQFGYEDDLVRQMDEVGVEKIAISTLIGLNIDCKRGNDLTAAVIKKYPERILGMATINPNREDEITSELERCFDSLGMTMIKLHPEESECPMNRKSYDLVYEFASERKLAILNHDWQSPQRLESLAKRFPQVRFVQAHSAGNWDGHRDDDYFRVARDYENVFVDICASPVFYYALEKLVEIAGADNILFGSDAPFLNLGFAIGKVMLADLTDTDKQKILADNFLRMIA